MFKGLSSSFATAGCVYYDFAVSAEQQKGTSSAERLHLSLDFKPYALIASSFETAYIHPV